MADGRSPEDPDRRTGRDEVALRNLSLAYATAADARDGLALAALFVDDGTLMVPRYPADLRPVVARSGADALHQVAEMLRRYDRTFHVVSDARFVVDGEDASGEVDCVAHHVTGAEGGPGASEAGAPAGTDMVWFIRYRDRYRRTGTGWRFVRRELHLQWVEEHRVSVIGEPPG